MLSQIAITVTNMVNAIELFLNKMKIDLERSGKPKKRSGYGLCEYICIGILVLLSFITAIVLIIFAVPQLIVQKIKLFPNTTVSVNLPWYNAAYYG
jgi:hypothetical protein